MLSMKVLRCLGFESCVFGVFFFFFSCIGFKCKVVKQFYVCKKKMFMVNVIKNMAHQHLSTFFFSLILPKNARNSSNYKRTICVRSHSKYIEHSEILLVTGILFSLTIFF